MHRKGPDGFTFSVAMYMSVVKKYQMRQELKEINRNGDMREHLVGALRRGNETIVY